jgi:hypothetical protein
MRDDVKHQQGQIVICHLCDKQLLKTDDAVVGKQSGDMIHMSCYRTWLIEKMRGKDV